MDTMKALVIYEDGRAALEQVPMPVYGDYEALVKITASALCGTDMKILHNSLKGFTDYPTILGHEGVGEVVAVGSKVRHLKVGDSVVLPFVMDKCGEFYSTWGAICEYSTVGDAAAMVEDGLKMGDGTLADCHFAQRVYPGSIDPVAATMIVTFREVYSTMLRLGFKKGQSIVIFGAGPVGLAFIRLAKHMGLGPVISIVRNEAKAQQAWSAGPDYVFNSSEIDINAKLREMFPDGVDVLLDAVGAPELINQSLKLVKDYGDVCIYGVMPVHEYPINWAEAPYSFNLRFAQWPSKLEEAAVHDEIVEWMCSGVLKGEDYISDVFDLDHALDAIELFRNHKNTKKVVIRM